MISVLESKKVCATIVFLFALAVMVNSFAGGPLPSFGSAIIAPAAPQRLLADDPFFPPDPWRRA